MVEPGKRSKVLLIGWDGADWQHIQPLLDQGLMPNLQHMISGGVMGNIATLNPILSPMLWNSVATGKMADQHGILGFSEPDPVNGGCRPSASTSRKAKALWNILSQEGLESNIVNWWASHPAEPIKGAMVSNSFVHSLFHPKRGWKNLPGLTHPPELIEEIGRLRMHVTEITDQEILPFIPLAAKVDQDKDRNLETFAKQLAQCVSIQAVGTWLMENRPWDFTAMYFEGIDHFCHAFMPYAPPRLPHIKEELYEIYKDVIAGAYRFHDMMLGRQLALAGEDAYVILCSDHGFLSGAHRPRFTPREPAGPAYWHRELGIFVMKGPGVRKDELTFGTSLLDIAPTILHLFGLPIGEDMPGRVRLDAFSEPTDVKTIPSWEEVQGDSGQHPPGTEIDAQASDELMQQFVALGYVEDPGKDREEAARKAETELNYNLARVYLFTGRAEKALPILEELTSQSAWENRFLLNLARAYYECGYLRQAERLMSTSYPSEEHSPAVALALHGRILVGLGQLDDGLSLLQKAQNKQATLAGLHVEIARTYFAQRQWIKAREASERELELNPNSGDAHGLLAASLLRIGENEAAVDSALTAVSIKHWYPQAHYTLGVAAARLGWYERAERALKTSIQMSPSMISAHRMLARIYRRNLDQLNQAAFHLEIARQERERQRENTQIATDRAEATFPLPAIPRPKERWETLNEERPRGGRSSKSKEKSGKTFTIVSGLPRSGTSLMMQILAAGGVSPKTDGQRSADEDNPEGYLEWEEIKEIRKRPELMDEEDLDQKAIKVISMLLPHLPEHHDYRVIFMNRPPEEVARSQERMIERLGTTGAEGGVENVRQQLQAHRAQVLAWLRTASHMEVLVIEYPELVKKPEIAIQRIHDFVGSDKLTKPSEMAKAVKPELYRQRVDTRVNGKESEHPEQLEPGAPKE